MIGNLSNHLGKHQSQSSKTFSPAVGLQCVLGITKDLNMTGRVAAFLVLVGLVILLCRLSISLTPATAAFSHVLRYNLFQDLAFTVFGAMFYGMLQFWMSCDDEDSDTIQEFDEKKEKDDIGFSECMESSMPPEEEIATPDRKKQPRKNARRPPGPPRPPRRPFKIRFKIRCLERALQDAENEDDPEWVSYVKSYVQYLKSG